MRAERGRLAGALADRAVAIEHVGSTAVHGLAAKPIIDILVSLASLDGCVECIAPLAALGHAFLDYPQNVERKFLRRGVPRSHHVHLVTAGGAEKAAHLDFRDALRADGAVRDEYAALKRSLASQNAQHRATYWDGKSAFIARVLERARAM